QSRVKELQAVLDVVPVGVGIAHDPDGRRITHNPYISELLGVPAWENASLSAVVGVRPSYKIYRDGKELPPDQLPMQLACSGVEIRDFEVDLVRDGHSPVRLVCHARPLRDGQGRVRGSVGAVLNITDRKQAEERLRTQMERLRLLSEAAEVLLHAD